MSAKRKLVRRFEPRFGVSAQMLEAEAVYVAREREDYRLLSTTDLRQKLQALERIYWNADALLATAVQGLQEREQLPIRCLIARDLYFILELYCTHFRLPIGRRTADESGPIEPGGENKQSVVPFSEWLFDPVRK